MAKKNIKLYDNVSIFSVLMMRLDLEKEYGTLKRLL